MNSLKRSTLTMLDYLTELGCEDLGEFSLNAHQKIDSTPCKAKNVINIHHYLKEVKKRVNIDLLFTESQQNRLDAAIIEAKGYALEEMIDFTKRVLERIIEVRNRKSRSNLSESAGFGKNYFGKLLKDEVKPTEDTLLKIMLWIYNNDNNLAAMANPDQEILKTYIDHLKEKNVDSEEERKKDLVDFLRRHPKEVSFIYYLSFVNEGIHSAEIQRFGIKYRQAMDILIQKGFMKQLPDSMNYMGSPVINEMDLFQVGDDFESCCRDLYMNGLFNRASEDDGAIPIPYSYSYVERVSVDTQKAITKALNDATKKVKELIENDNREGKQTTIASISLGCRVLDYSKFLDKVK